MAFNVCLPFPISISSNSIWMTDIYAQLPTHRACALCFDMFNYKSSKFGKCVTFEWIFHSKWKWWNEKSWLWRPAMVVAHTWMQLNTIFSYLNCVSLRKIVLHLHFEWSRARRTLRHSMLYFRGNIFRRKPTKTKKICFTGKRKAKRQNRFFVCCYGSSVENVIWNVSWMARTKLIKFQFKHSHANANK